jgi:hypothetical protein
MTRLALLLLALATGSGCAVIVQGSPLSSRPAQKSGLYLSTGDHPGDYHTLGFIQVMGYGVEVAGALDVGDAVLDGAIQGALADAARKMGGDGVIHIEFLDTNPSTPAERMQAAAETGRNLRTGEGGVKTKDRWVIVTGQVIQLKGGGGVR